jgi:hypothetical protein
MVAKNIFKNILFFLVYLRVVNAIDLIKVGPNRRPAFRNGMEARFDFEEVLEVKLRW